ncbi:SDR family oxidoreductase [Catenulispora subtropica]|uniref:SDR family oxidoreductase n=1 Tax=Catenulispora subtropica TaxID=450798 RepID=A0ABN2RUG7_9ACTN
MTQDVRTLAVTVEGGKLSVRTCGDPSKPTVLLVHGYPDTQAVWDGVVSELVDDFHVVTYDTRGIGASKGPLFKHGYTLERLADDLYAVADIVAPGQPVHLVGHDWGSIQAWEAVTRADSAQRFLSYTSISGPCLDHAAMWTRSGLRKPTPKAAARSLKQALASWYIVVFHLPVGPRVVWRLGLAKQWPRIIKAIEGTSLTASATLSRDGSRGVLYYRANMLPKMRRPEERPTSVPVQVLTPTGDRFVTPALAAQAPVPWTERLYVRKVSGGHWIVVKKPALIAERIKEFALSGIATPGGPEPVRSLLRAEARQGTKDRREFEDKLVVVTGAGSGIGRATALAFAEKGADIVVADIDAVAAARTVELVELLGARAYPYTVDVASAEAMEQFAEDVKATAGVPDVVVNNAGIGMSGPFLATEVKDWERILGVNVWGVIHGARCFGEMMRERGEGGHIVNLASAAAYTPSRTLSAYSTSKAAVLMLSECLRAEFARYGIGVSAICPGFIATNITRTTKFVGQSAEQQERTRQRLTGLYRRRDFGPDKVAERIVAAVRRDQPVVPVALEAKVSKAVSRLSPALARRMAKIDPTG